METLLYERRFADSPIEKIVISSADYARVSNFSIEPANVHCLKGWTREIAV